MSPILRKPLRALAVVTATLAFLALVAVITNAVLARHSPYDADVALDPIGLDITNPAVQKLAAMLRASPNARRLRLRWEVQPDSARPSEVLARTLVYDRPAGTLDYHRNGDAGDMHFSGVTDRHIEATAAHGEALLTMARYGCTVSSSDSPGRAAPPGQN